MDSLFQTNENGTWMSKIDDCVVRTYFHIISLIIGEKTLITIATLWDPVIIVIDSIMLPNLILNINVISFAFDLALFPSNLPHN